MSYIIAQAKSLLGGKSIGKIFGIPLREGGNIRNGLFGWQFGLKWFS